MRQKKFFLLIILFAIFFIYITNISAIPENITLIQNEKYEIGFLRGIDIEGEENYKTENFFTKLATINSEIVGNAKLKLTALGIIPIKDITVSVIPQIEVVPSGIPAGVMLYSKGVLVVGSSEITGIDGKNYYPIKETNIEPGDIITNINSIETETIEELKEALKSANGNEIEITYIKDKEEIIESVKPIKSVEDGEYRIGLWVKDGAMGIGTITFYTPNTSKYAALGHGISDIDTGKLINIESGDLNSVKILSISKSSKSNPGEIRGVLEADSNLGNVTQNTEFGIFGNLTGEKNKLAYKEAIPIASRNEIETGKAKLLCALDGENVKEYEIEIQKINNKETENTKSMIIKITDEELLEKTGGIVQGMSGSPIIQNGKLVSAVTHVFVNDPTRGYAIFADTMIKEIT